MEDREYIEIELDAGSTIDEAVSILQRHEYLGHKVFASFNGVKLYSDNITLDRAYLAITGKTKAENEKRRAELREEYKREQEEHKRKIPELTEHWKAKGREILEEDKWKLWDKIVPIRLNDLYEGLELKCCLEIVQALNQGCTMREARDIFDKQGHSGMSASLVSCMLKEFSPRGEEFFMYLYHK